MRNIIFISHHLSGVGGVQKFIEVLAQQFLKDGHHVDVIGISVPKGTTYGKPMLAHENYQEYSLYQQDVFTTYMHRLFADAFISRKSAKKIQAIIDSREKPIVIIANPLTYIILKNVDFSNAQQVLGQMHSSASYLFNNSGMYKAYLYFVKKYYHQLDKFLFLTAQDAREAIETLGWDNIAHVANPLPFTFDANNLAPLTNKKIVMAGRIDENKQVDHAVAIFAKITQDFPEWNFEIYGTGNKEDEIHKQIESMGLSDKIILKGFTNDIKKVLFDASIMLLTSKKEGIPMAAMEAIACGVPVIAYDCSPGVAEVVGNAGIIIPSDDQETFAKSLAALMADDTMKQQLQKKGYEYIQQYDVKKIASDWYEIFDERTERK